MINEPGTLNQALIKLGYNDKQIKSLIEIFFATGIFHAGAILKEHPINIPLDKAIIDKLLASNLGIENANITQIIEKFNQLGQAQYAKMRNQAERSQMSKISLPAEFTEHFNILDFYNEKLPAKDAEYYYIFGATEFILAKRLNFLQEKLATDIIDKKLVFLTGDRKLWPQYSGNKDIKISGENATFKLIKDLNKNLLKEADIIELKEYINKFFEDNQRLTITEMTNEISKKFPQLYWPTELDLAKYLANDLIDSKIDIEKFYIKGKVDPNIGRPTTMTTLVAMKEQIPNLDNQAKLCFISSQPYIKRQEKEAKLCLDEFPNIESCGLEINKNIQESPNIAIRLEALLGEINSGFLLYKNRYKEKNLGEFSNQQLDDIIKKEHEVKANYNKIG